MNLINTITINESKKREEKKDDVDPLDILTDLKGDDDTQVYESVKTSVTSITEIKEKEDNNNKETKKEELDNSFYSTDMFKKKDFEDDDNEDFLDNDKVSIGIKILIALVIIVFLVGLFLFLKSFLKF